MGTLVEDLDVQEAVISDHSRLEVASVLLVC